MRALKLTSLALAMALGGAHAYAVPYAAPAILGAGQTYTFENGLIALGASGFSDSFTFSLGAGATSAHFLFNIGLPTSKILTETFAVSHSGKSIAVSGGNVFETYSRIDEDGEKLNFTLLDKAEFTFDLAGLDAGAKTINVSGLFASPFSEARNYSLTVSALAVPEPESYALFLAALGLMAGIARRNSKSN
jgi:hypothetical protein